MSKGHFQRPSSLGPGLESKLGEGLFFSSKCPQTEWVLELSPKLWPHLVSRIGERGKKRKHLDDLFPGRENEGTFFRIEAEIKEKLYQCRSQQSFSQWVHSQNFLFILLKAMRPFHRSPDIFCSVFGSHCSSWPSHSHPSSTNVRSLIPWSLSVLTFDFRLLLGLMTSDEKCVSGTAETFSFFPIFFPPFFLRKEKYSSISGMPKSHCFL